MFHFSGKTAPMCSFVKSMFSFIRNDSRLLSSGFLFWHFFLNNVFSLFFFFKCYVCGCFTCMHACIYVCMYVHYMQAWLPWRSEEGIQSPGARVSNDCEPPWGCWESDLDPWRGASALNHWTISLAYSMVFEKDKPWLAWWFLPVIPASRRLKQESCRSWRLACSTS